MRTTFPAILALMLGLGIAAVVALGDEPVRQRPKVPLPPLAKELRASTLSVPVPKRAESPALRPLRVAVMTRPESGMIGGVLAVPEANLNGILALEAIRAKDADTLAEVRQAEGIAAPTGTVRPLPAFFTGLHWLPTATFTYKHEDRKLPAVPARVIRLVDGSAAWLLERLQAEPDQKVVVLITGNEIGLADGRALKLLASPQVVAVIVGHIVATEGDPKDFPANAAMVLEHLQLVRSVSDAPVLLSASWTNSHEGNRRIAADWPRAFGDRIDRFDGLAVYNAGLFPLWESMTRTKLTSQLGLPEDMPTILLDFEGTRDGDSGPRSAELWKRRGRRFIEARRKEGWRGVLLVSTGTTAWAIEDYRRKAAMLKRLPGKLQFQEAKP